MKCHHRSAVTTLFVVALGASNVTNAAPVSGQGTWETTLQGRDLDGNLATAEAYYDTALNITWLADANYGYGSSYDSADGYIDGLMYWATANAWAASLNFNGITGWGLPNTNPLDGVAYYYEPSTNGDSDVGYNISAPGSAYPGSTASEMAHLFYNTLGDKAPCDPASTTTCIPQAGWGLTNTGPFSNVQADVYWSATEHALGGGLAWDFTFSDGGQLLNSQTGGYHAWAVHSGDVGAPIPVPAAVWLFGSGLLGLIGVARRKARSA